MGLNWRWSSTCHNANIQFNKFCLTHPRLVTGANFILALSTTVALVSSLWKRERNVLFNDALNTFYLRLYGLRHMVKDHSDSEKGNLLTSHGLLFPINSKGSFICTIPQHLLHQSWSTGWNEKYFVKMSFQVTVSPKFLPLHQLMHHTVYFGHHLQPWHHLICFIQVTCIRRRNVVLPRC